MCETIGLNSFAIKTTMQEEVWIVEENITQERAFELLAEDEDAFLEVYKNGRWVEI